MAFFLASGPIAIVRILLRLWRRAFWWDDVWAVISLVSFATFVPSKPNPLHSLPHILLIFLQVYSLLLMVRRSPNAPVSSATTWVSKNLLLSDYLIHSCTNRSCPVLLFHYLDRPSFHHLHCHAYHSAEVPEEGPAGRRRCDIPPMGSLGGSTILGLREG